MICSPARYSLLHTEHLQSPPCSRRFGAFNCIDKRFEAFNGNRSRLVLLKSSYAESVVFITVLPRTKRKQKRARKKAWFESTCMDLNDRQPLTYPFHRRRMAKWPIWAQSLWFDFWLLAIKGQRWRPGGEWLKKEFMGDVQTWNTNGLITNYTSQFSFCFYYYCKTEREMKDLTDCINY